MAIGLGIHDGIMQAYETKAVKVSRTNLNVDVIGSYFNHTKK